MKTTAKTFLLLLVINSLALMMPQKTVAQASINFQLFYDNLSPHGYWVDNSAYGYVWVPNVPAGFSPYGTNGYWTYTNLGWTWVSDYSWGWAPFHYGRWFYDPFYGWLWVPGYDWAPAWVVWRSSPGYYGWAPVGPANYQISYNHYIFVNNNHFGSRNISNYYVSPSRNTTIIRDSRVINNVRQDNSSRARYNAGPDRAEVQKLTKRTISPVTVANRSKPGQSLKGSELQVYRPNVVKGKAAPSKVAEWKERKPAPQRTERSQPAREVKTSSGLSQERRAANPVRQQPAERRAPVKTAERPAVQQRDIQQVSKERQLQQTREIELQERNDRQQAAERQLQQQRASQQSRQERPVQQVPERRPSNDQVRPQPQLPQQTMPQQRMPQEGRSNGQARQQQMPQQMPQQQMPPQGNGQHRGHQR